MSLFQVHSPALENLCKATKSVAGVEVSMLREKKKTMSDMQLLHEFFERTAELAVPGEIAAPKRLSEAEADLEIRRWDQTNSEISLYESHRELEPQRIQLHQAKQWADQAQGEKIDLCRELEMRNRMSHKNLLRKELRKICCEETKRVTQLRIDELYMQQERGPTTVSQLLSQIQDLQNEVNSLSEEGLSRS